MGDLERRLIPGETVVYKTGWHWIIMRWSLLAGFILCATGIGALVGAREWTGANEGASHRGLLGLGGGALIVGIAVIVSGIIRRAATEMAVSNKRLLIKSGYFSRKSTEVLLTKVESIGIDESFMGRILGYGTVVIRGTGGTFETIEEIRKPNEFRRHVQAQLSSAARDA